MIHLASCWHLGHFLFAANRAVLPVTPQKLLLSGKEAGFTGVHSSVPMQSGYTTDVISYVTGYYSIDGHRNKLGELIINVEYRTLEKNSPVSSSYELLNAENGNSIALDYAPLPKELINNITTEHIMYSSKKSSAARCSHFLFCLALGSDFNKILFVTRPA